MKLYYVTQDGYRLTERLTIKQITAKFGSIQMLESAGLRVVPV